MSVTALRRAVERSVARRSDAIDRCGLCAGPVAPRHRHVLDEHQGGLLCACTACAMLFERDAAGGKHYRLVPTGRHRLAGLRTDALNVPVGLAFFVKQDDGRVLAHYPSPLGTTESRIDRRDWRGVERQSPALAAMAPRVQALLVRTGTMAGRDRCWILPIDECYRLVAVIRRHWTGMAGGSAVWKEIARFFDDLGGHLDPTGDDPAGTRSGAAVTPDERRRGSMMDRQGE